MRVEIKPSKAHGTVTAPPSKSMAHRLLICAGLAEGESVVRNLSYSEDIKATIACLRSLGADIRPDGNTAYITGTDVTKPTGRTAVLPCNESGSTLRFFTPICLLNGEEHILTGSARLMSRPLDFYRTLARIQKLDFEEHPNRVIVKGPMTPAVFVCPGNISSQFCSGMMFALPLLKRNSFLAIRKPLESRPYLDMTIKALELFGVGVFLCDNKKMHNAETGTAYAFEEDQIVFRIPGGDRYIPADVTVEGDYSNAAFFEALNYAGSKVSVSGLDKQSMQGDRVYKELFEKLDTSDGLFFLDPIDISDCPDLGPVLFATAALCGGGRFTGTRRLRIKESDRSAAMKHELKKVGIEVTVEENAVTVHPGNLHAPSVPIDGHNDHRIVMAMSVLLTKVGGMIEGAEAVNKSFPDFFEKLQKLGIEVTICNGSATPES